MDFGTQSIHDGTAHFEFLLRTGLSWIRNGLSKSTRRP
jgi:hypothetical protein